MRTPRVTAFHIGLIKRMAKSYSGVSNHFLTIIQTRVACWIYGLTFCATAKFLFGFSKQSVPDPMNKEIYYRLNSIFSKNKYGYNTRFMSDFDLLLEGVLNEQFVYGSTEYYNDPVVASEVEDMEKGLNGEFSDEDIRNLLKDKGEHCHGEKSFRYPARVASAYPATDDLSIYKTHPVGSKPAF